MNINQLNPIKSINLEERVGKVEPNGTFAEILDAVMTDKLVPIVDPKGNIIGGSYNMPAVDLVADNINKIRFERRYACKPVLEWMMKALEIKVKPEVSVYGIERVDETEDYIEVVLNNGECIPVYERPQKANSCNDADEMDLPGTIYIEDLGVDVHASIRDIRRAVKQKYGYFLAKSYDVEENMDWNNSSGNYYLANVKWGRKATAEERAA